MTREQAKKKLIDLGVAEPTEEQVSKYLDSIDAETKSEKAKADRLKSENEKLQELADKADELQKEKDEMEQGKLTEIEKANKAVEDVTKANADLQRQLNEMKFAKNLADNGIVGEQADSIVKSFMSGDFESATKAFGQIVSERESAAALAKEQEIANASANPGGQNGSGGEEKSSAVRLVEKHFGKQTASTDIISHYVNGGK